MKVLFILIISLVHLNSYGQTYPGCFVECYAQDSIGSKYPGLSVTAMRCSDDFSWVKAERKAINVCKEHSWDKESCEKMDRKENCRDWMGQYGG